MGKATFCEKAEVVVGGPQQAGHKVLNLTQLGSIPPLIDWISYGITNSIYPDPDPFVSHAKIQGAIVQQRKALRKPVRREGLPEIQGPRFCKTKLP